MSEATRHARWSFGSFALAEIFVKAAVAFSNVGFLEKSSLTSLVHCSGVMAFIISRLCNLENCTNFLGFSFCKKFFTRDKYLIATASKGDCFADDIVKVAARSE